ncbi:hypothetical protein FJZ33_04520, partial [Candidatus Poribacteria bacterium]|nr:hypothetical protein [Candidatus Poribacteria bacterium]
MHDKRFGRGKMKNGIISFLVLVSVFFYVHESSAVPPDPNIYPTWLSQNSIYQTPIETMESISRPPEDLTRGNQEIVVILVEFQNVSHSIIHDIPYFENLIFSSSNPNSMFNYYKEVSYGQLTITGAVTGWYRSKENMEYYGKDGNKNDNFNTPIYELTREAIKLADSNGFDFS